MAMAGRAWRRRGRSRMGHSKPPSLTLPGTNAISLAVADFNGDGKLDLAVGSLSAGNTSQVSILLGNGDGTFQPSLNSTVPNADIDAIAAADFNGDGKL